MRRCTTTIVGTGLQRLLLVLSLLALSAVGLSGGGLPADMKDRVYDRLFRSSSSAPFLTKMTLRYGDSDSQLVVLTYPVYPVHPAGQAELVSYKIAGMGTDNLSQFISKMASQNENVTDEEIAAKLKVEVKRSPIRYETLGSFLDELKTIRMSPVLSSRIAVDEYSDYDFWYDGGQESVHYKLVGPFKDDPQDKLVQWMIRFRSAVPQLTSAAPPKR